MRAGRRVYKQPLNVLAAEADKSLYATCVLIYIDLGLRQRCLDRGEVGPPVVRGYKTVRIQVGS